MKFSKNKTILALFLAAFTLWIYLFRDFWTYYAHLFPDGRSYYRITKNFLDNIVRFVYPIWNPFTNWGITAGMHMRFLGEFNLFLLVPLIVYNVSNDFQIAYFTYVISYYFFGVTGFYLISKLYFKDAQYAFISATLLLFSSAGITIFFNYCEIVIFVPAIWFFYFLLSFSESQERKYFLGIIFSLMIILTTYIPFYFLTIFLAFLILFATLCPGELIKYLKKYMAFTKKNKVFFVICLTALALSAVPGVIWYLAAGSGEFSYDFRHSGSAAKNVATLGKEMISLGGIIGPITFKKLFSNLSYQTNQLSYFFLPVFVYIVLFLSIFNKLKKRMLITFSVGFLMFLLSLTYVVGLHGFLYDHVFFLKIIRNVYYVLQMALPFIILFIVDQLKVFLENRSDTSLGLTAKLFFIFIVHMLFAGFLYGLGDIVVTSYVTVAGSLLFFVLWAVGVLRPGNKIFILLIFPLLVIQPAEVFLSYCKNVSSERPGGYPSKREHPVFYYSRESSSRKSSQNSANAFSENRGFISNSSYAGVSGSYALVKNISEDVLTGNVLNKFIAYDRTEAMDMENISWDKIALSFSKNLNVAFVPTDKSDINISAAPKYISSKAMVIKEDSEMFKVLDFDLNYIKFKTNFDEDKFVVYNDSYHSGWRAHVDGRPHQIIRANIAFKGLWLKPGENIVYMQFGSKFLHAFYLSLMVLFYGFFVWLILSYVNLPKKQRVSNSE